MNEVKAPALNPKLVKFAEHQRNLHRIEIPNGIGIENLERPEFWVHCAKRFKTSDKVEAIAQDNAWYAELLVTKVEPLAVSMVLITFKDLRGLVAQAATAQVEVARLPIVAQRPAALQEPAAKVPDQVAEASGSTDVPQDGDPFVVKFGGGDKWRVIRTYDMTVVHKGEPSRAAAQAWLDNHLAEKIGALKG